jgi:alpha-beta hydrolase superfamily lysophospholipase
MDTNFFIADDGTRLACSARYVRNSKIGVIILHGLAEHKGRYNEFAERLAGAGISVFAFDLRGHGASRGQRGDVKRFDDWLGDLDIFVRGVRAKYPKLKLALFGHSLGGLISAAYAGKSRLIDLLVLSSPSLETPAAIGILRLFPSWLLGKIHMKKRHSESQEMLEYSRNDLLACHRFTLRLLKVAFIHGIRRANDGLANIDVPTLMLGGRQDPLVNSGKLESILQKFGSRDKTLVVYENAKHRIVQNAAKDKAIPDIINWLQTRA